MAEQSKKKVAVVTGASRGIGRAIALELASRGAAVVINYNGSEERAREVQKEIEEKGGEAEIRQWNVADYKACESAVKDIVKTYGSIDILVNNAGNHCKKYIWDMSVEDYKNVLDVHLVGAFALTKAFIPQMKERGWGRIIFQASMTSYIGQPQVCGYSTAKAGYLGLIHTLTAEVAEYGITVNAIAPGWIDTPMFHKAVDNDPPRLAKILGRIPAKSVGDPMDVGMCAAFLCSDAARYFRYMYSG